MILPISVGGTVYLAQPDALKVSILYSTLNMLMYQSLFSYYNLQFSLLTRLYSCY